MTGSFIVFADECIIVVSCMEQSHNVCILECRHCVLDSKCTINKSNHLLLLSLGTIYLGRGTSNCIPDIILETDDKAPKTIEIVDTLLQLTTEVTM
jgi:hypothetical protein